MTLASFARWSALMLLVGKGESIHVGIVAAAIPLRGMLTASAIKTINLTQYFICVV
jgi:hypothetical protein